MASIQKRGSKYRARVTREGKSTLSSTFKTKAEAIAWASEVHAKIRLNLLENPLLNTAISKNTSFGVAAQHYIDKHSIYKKSSKSEIGLISILIRRWGNLSVLEITKARVITFRDEMLAMGRSGSTINHYFNVISKIYQMLSEEWDLAISNPITGLKRIPSKKGRAIRVSKQVEVLLMDGCKQLNIPLLASIIEFAIQTGMRRGEIIGLTWSDIDIEKRKAYLDKTKNGESRQVPLTLQAVRLLDGLPRVNAKVFPMGFDCLRRQFRRLKRHIRNDWHGYGDNPFDNLRFHDLRHEALSRLSDAGLNVIELSHISGHRTLGMLKRYTHPSHEAIFAKLDK